MTRTELGKPPGTDFLEKIYQQKEEEKRMRYEEAEKNKWPGQQANPQNYNFEVP